MGRVRFGFLAVHEEVVLRVEQPVDGLVQAVGADALEGADGIEQRTGDYEHLLTGVFGHAGEVEVPSKKCQVPR